MRNWGIVITAFYVLVVIFLFTYGVVLLVDPYLFDSIDFSDFFEGLTSAWILILIILPAQVLLLFLSVDTSWRRMQPQRHVMVTASLVGLAVAVLTAGIFLGIGAVHWGDDFLDSAWLENLQISASLAIIILIWAFWAVLFYMFSRRASNIVDSAVKWLITGSVLELLIAVPSHIIVRQRNECSAPLYSAYGIATGIAIMLMAFGPGAMFLYQRKIGDYKEKKRRRS